MKKVTVKVSGKVADKDAERIVNALEATIGLGLLAAKLNGIVDDEVTHTVEDV